ncbi:hypothetical protein [Vogesella indigofera]|uniref:hypothetical protein n=1 Tax=Vogesella indigofera TaxID=45465 RepID=UPI00234F03A3|nr:hypothetical protein [Vogesella indigofera]MDC7712414.1 hypothetical protein [Vogesella indigofera]
MSSSPLLASVLKDRGSIVELVLAAVVLGLGVNLIASAIGTYFQDAVWSLALLGFSLVVLGIAVTARRMFGANSIDRRFEGFICFRHQSFELIPVPRYEYVEKLIKHVNALFAENEAPKKLWESDPVHKSFEVDLKTLTVKKRTTAAGQLVIEATEYFALEMLSTHLTDYFNQSGLETKKLRTLGRNDVPTLVFKNRFLDTFSRPMRERAAFVDQTLSEQPWHEQAVASYSGDLQYQKFDLVLPKEATVSRVHSNSILIDAPKFSMTLSVSFDGIGSAIPRGFEELYLGDFEFSDISVYQVGISVRVNFKPFSLLSRTGWEYHSWLDSFLIKLDHQFSRTSFIKHIQWHGAATLARVIERVIAKQGKNAQQPPTASDA